ncbi:bifunctional DNA-binding transcriptional regulator/O6-methylguanine-DNA methyltransferase Ada [Azospirillum sp. B510]|uniref:bifunctional DNA-binding transcriptional regulator/O6-methylguanine-DNA methyltransferase Ada n=1 Tax=Azospirillum sp. (strain B510) TaxID=137722 RepID=UPI0005A6089A|nr:bifunctional DNA-binding transcriptional regulator/O6-methylguanine-DNA methyltransferase Ada [Azospirillum sp. B510]
MASARDDITESNIIEAERDRWEALRRRDPAADGLFVYAVRSTGVYCRPSCAARPARPANVVFYATNAEAERAGFRPCKRCRPDGPSQGDRRAEAVARACRLIEEAEDAPRLEDLAAAAGMSPHHFHRIFKQVTGVTPRAYVEAQRAARVADALRQAGSVTEAIYEAGYGSSGRFYETAGARLGMTPTSYRKGGVGQTIRFAVGGCALGSILVAATERGVCAILLGDDPDILLRDLQDRFPKAELIGGDAAFEATVAQVVGFVEAPGTGLTLPLDIGGTAFQQRVWQALRAIPAGRTASYAEIATAIGEPAAVRAVARACGANPLAVAIPCHRVVRSDGGLSGYRWGIERKRDLLERERGIAAPHPAAEGPRDPMPRAGE